MAREPEYIAIAAELRGEIQAGVYDETGTLPGTSTLAERFRVNMKTAGRAIQQLAAEGVVIPRRGLTPLVQPPDQRATAWPMTGRYARARAATGLLFGDDVPGTLRKDTVSIDWVAADMQAAGLLGCDVGERILRRQSRTVVDGITVENTAMHFPESIVAAVPQLAEPADIRVVELIEGAGYSIDRTANRIYARLATDAEQSIFGQDGGAPIVVVEQAHSTYEADGQVVEAVVNVRPAAGNVITFDTYEGPLPEEN
ncbi:MAG: GntR family transcriptional regulator [Actinomycetota bacterium]